MRGENTTSALPPFRASEVQAAVVLIPPLADGSEVQERITHETVTDMQRYILLADKLLAKAEEKLQGESASNAA